jgi:hypothetical protein
MTMKGKPPAVALGRFPYRNHRTVAEWRDGTSPTERRTFLWCEQCDARVDDRAAARCRSRFCQVGRGAA